MTATHTPTPGNSFDVLIERGGQKLKAGRVNRSRDGFRFYPMTTAHQPSRRGWDTPDSAVPRWIGDYQLIDVAGDPADNLAGALSKLSYKFAFDGPEANTLGAAAACVNAHNKLVADLERCKAALRFTNDCLRDAEHDSGCVRMNDELLAELDKGQS